MKTVQQEVKEVKVSIGPVYTNHFKLGTHQRGKKSACVNFV